MAQAFLRDATSGAKLHQLRGHGNSVVCAAIRPDGKQVATGSVDGSAILWDVVTGAKVRSFGGQGTVTAVCFSPDGKRLVTGSADTTARVWDVATGKERCALIGSEAGKDWAVVTPGGQHDGSAAGLRAVAFRRPRSLELVGPEQHKEFPRPGLPSRAWKGEDVR